jgi:hypothetical protein
VQVTASPLKEEAPVGVYCQPEWTQYRRFPMSRVYVQYDPWELGIEQWWRGRFYKDGSRKHRFQEEVELGLPGRVQADVYFNWTLDNDNKADFEAVAPELRYAFADWGEIPMNPTLYLEWKFMNAAPDVYEVKILLGDDIGAGWRWAVNLIHEQEIAGERATEWAVSAALGCTLIDQVLNVGAETKCTRETVAGERDDPSEGVLLGPSLQWRPWPGAHLDLACLFGLTDDSPRVESYVVFGIDLIRGKESKAVKAPISTRGQ